MQQKQPPRYFLQHQHRTVCVSRPLVCFVVPCRSSLSRTSRDLHRRSEDSERSACCSFIPSGRRQGCAHNSAMRKHGLNPAAARASLASHELSRTWTCTRRLSTSVTSRPPTAQETGKSRGPTPSGPQRRIATAAADHEQPTTAVVAVRQAPVRAIVPGRGLQGHAGGANGGRGRGGAAGGGGGAAVAGKIKDHVRDVLLGSCESCAVPSATWWLESID